MFSLRRWIRSLRFRSVRSRQIVKRRRPSIRLFSEMLEDRTVPTTLTVTAGDTVTLISDISQADSNSTTANPYIIELSNGTYSFSSANNTTDGTNVLPVITAANLTIEGNGSILNANSQGRLLNVASGGSLTLKNLTLTGGLAKRRGHGDGRRCHLQFGSFDAQQRDGQFKRGPGGRWWNRLRRRLVCGSGHRHPEQGYLQPQ